MHAPDFRKFQVGWPYEFIQPNNDIGSHACTRCQYMVNYKLTCIDFWGVGWGAKRIVSAPLNYKLTCIHKAHPLIHILIE